MYSDSLWSSVTNVFGLNLIVTVSLEITSMSFIGLCRERWNHSQASTGWLLPVTSDCTFFRTSKVYEFLLLVQNMPLIYIIHKVWLVCFVAGMGWSTWNWGSLSHLQVSSGNASALARVHNPLEWGDGCCADNISSHKGFSCVCLLFPCFTSVHAAI